MNAAQFLETYGEAETARVCQKAKTKLVYFQQCVDGKRNFGRKTAEMLEIASDGRMTRVELVFPDYTPPKVRPARAARAAA